MIEPCIWHDPDFEEVEEFTPIGVYVYLMSNERCGWTGMYKLSMRKAMLETRLDANQLLTSFQLLANQLEYPKIMFDSDSKWIWVRGLFSRNYKMVKNENTAKSVISEMVKIESNGCPFIDDFKKKYNPILLLVNNWLVTKHDKNKIRLSKDKIKGDIQGGMSMWEVNERIKALESEIEREHSKDPKSQILKALIKKKRELEKAKAGIK